MCSTLKDLDRCRGKLGALMCVLALTPQRSPRMHSVSLQGLGTRRGSEPAGARPSRGVECMRGERWGVLDNHSTQGLGTRRETECMRGERWGVVSRRARDDDDARSSSLVVVVWPPGGTHTGHHTTNMDGCLYGEAHHHHRPFHSSLVVY